MSFPYETINEAHREIDRMCRHYSWKAKVLHNFLPYAQLPNGLIVAPVWDSIVGLRWAARTSDWESPIWAPFRDTIESAFDDVYRNERWESEPRESANDLVSTKAAAEIFAALSKTDISDRLLLTLDGATITMTAKPPEQIASIQISTPHPKLVRARIHKNQMLRRRRWSSPKSKG